MFTFLLGSLLPEAERLLSKSKQVSFVSGSGNKDLASKSCRAEDTVPEDVESVIRHLALAVEGADGLEELLRALAIEAGQIAAAGNSSKRAHSLARLLEAAADEIVRGKSKVH